MLSRIERRGYRVMEDSARKIIRQRKRQGLSARPDAARFALNILADEIQDYESAKPARSDLVFFERGILDALCMLAHIPEHSVDIESYIDRYPYHDTVFILPPWREIYRQDEERDQSYEDAVRVHAQIRHWYAECGHRLIEVQPDSIDARCAFVLGALEPESENPTSA
jgi:predicted ATPase